jgi:starvation-inducible outer membrane lipoprotein
MRKLTKSAAAAILALAMALALAACSAKGKIVEGTWDGSTFTNAWSQIKLTLPENARQLSATEINELLGQGEDILINDGVLDEAALNTSKARTVYDFFVYVDGGVSNLFLAYENLTIWGKGMTVADYLKQLQEQTAQVTAMGYEFLGEETATIAGETFTVNKYSIADQFYQRYYVRKLDGAFVTIVTTYPIDGEEDMLKLIASITKP